MKPYVVFIFTCILGFSASIPAKEIPSLVCRTIDVMIMSPDKIDPEVYQGTSLFRFDAGKLYISEGNREEYLYNDVVSANDYLNPLRYISGHDTIIFQEGFKKVRVIHAGTDFVSVGDAFCTKV